LSLSLELKVTHQSSWADHFTNERLDQQSDESQSARDGRKLGTAGVNFGTSENHSSKTTSSRLEWNSDPGWGGRAKRINHSQIVGLEGKGSKRLPKRLSGVSRSKGNFESCKQRLLLLLVLASRTAK
jgi:hypothetical protein